MRERSLVNFMPICSTRISAVKFEMATGDRLARSLEEFFEHRNLKDLTSCKTFDVKLEI